MTVNSLGKFRAFFGSLSIELRHSRLGSIRDEVRLFSYSGNTGGLSGVDNGLD